MRELLLYSLLVGFGLGLGGGVMLAGQLIRFWAWRERRRG